MLQVLVIEDDDRFHARFLEAVGTPLAGLARFTRVATGADARRSATGLVPDLVLCDLSLPPAPGEPPDDDEGERLLAWFEGLPAPPRLVVLSGQDLGRAIALVARRRIQDFLSKSSPWKEIEARLRTALDDARRQLREGEGGEPAPDDLVGDSAPMAEVRRLLARAAESDATVLLLGETGTGKSHAARWLHRRSGRKEGPLVAVAAGAFPDELVEAELFGHAAGAFTGAREARRGRFRAADGGTLFLDELGEIPPSTQAKLLRVLEERSVEPLGTDQAVPVDVRLVAATHRDLGAEVGEGRFREDLFYRLRVLTVVMPPLRARGEDLEALVTSFLAGIRPARRGLTEDAWAYLRSRPFKGNLRELRHALEAAALHATGDRITAVALHAGMGPAPTGKPAGASTFDPDRLLDEPGFALRDWLERHEAALVEAALRRADGQAAEAARLLGEKPDTLRARLRRGRKDTRESS